MGITAAIPTYRREQVLIETVRLLLAQSPPPGEILVLDQSEAHEPQTARALQAWDDEGCIRWIRLRSPSIPKAMNAALQLAGNDVVLFLDDDIRPEPGLVKAHLDAHARGETLVAGRVIQPWQEGREFVPGGAFHFACVTPQRVREFMGGNFSVRCRDAIALGGFDENFVRVAYRFEAEFAHRWLASGRPIQFEPAACLHHLKVSAGGTRTFGDHLATWRPDHSVGAYYFALRTGALREFAVRPLRSIANRHHLRRPWRIPATLTAELLGMAWALRLHLRGPARMEATTR